QDVLHNGISRPGGEASPFLSERLSPNFGRLFLIATVRIGLISDTHIPEARAELWPQVFDAFKGVDYILHAGDIHDLIAIGQLEAIAPIWVARGNGEYGSGGRPVQPQEPRLPEGW